MDFSSLNLQCAVSYVFGQSCIGGMGWGQSGALFAFLNSDVVVWIGGVIVGIPLIAFLLSRFLNVVLGWGGGAE